MSQKLMQSVVNFIFELGQLKEKPRSGWELIKIPDKENVASHVLRMSQLAFVLAVLEGHKNPGLVATKALFHENGETRIPDLHKVAARYIEKIHEDQVVADQTHGLGYAGELIRGYWSEVEYRSSSDGVLVKDADYLECAFTAKEYHEQGHVFAEGWITNVEAVLVTSSAKQLFAQMITMTSNDWWQGLKKFS